MLLGAERAVSKASVVSTTAAAVTIPGTATTASVGVQLTTGGGPSACAVSVHWETRAPTVAAGADFVVAPGRCPFRAGTAHGATQTLPITITLLRDAWDEDDETLVIALTSAPGDGVAAVVANNSSAFHNTCGRDSRGVMPPTLGRAATKTRAEASHSTGLCRSMIRCTSANSAARAA